MKCPSNKNFVKKQKQMKNLKNLLCKYVKIYLKSLKGKGEAVRWVFSKIQELKKISKSTQAGWVRYSSLSLSKDKNKDNSTATQKWLDITFRIISYFTSNKN